MFLKRVESVSSTYQLNSGNTSLKPALPSRSVLFKLEILPSRKRMFVGTSESPGSLSWDTPSPFKSMNVRVVRLFFHAWTETSPMLQLEPVQWVLPAVLVSLTGVEIPSTI